jgi:hypothetical protein
METQNTEAKQPKELVNRALEALNTHKRYKLVQEFCAISEKLGFNKEQIIRMIRNLPNQ